MYIIIQYIIKDTDKNKINLFKSFPCSMSMGILVIKKQTTKTISANLFFMKFSLLLIIIEVYHIL